MLSRILGVVWTALMLWTCADAIYDMTPAGPVVNPELRRTGGDVLGVVVLFAVWIAGLGAIVVVRAVFGQRGPGR